MILKKKTYPRRLRAVRVANAVNKVEGVPVTEAAQRLSIQWANGEITINNEISTDCHAQANRQSIIL